MLISQVSIWFCQLKSRESVLMLWDWSIYSTAIWSADKAQPMENKYFSDNEHRYEIEKDNRSQ